MWRDFFCLDIRDLRFFERAAVRRKLMDRNEAIATARMSMATSESVEVEMARINFRLQKMEQDEEKE